MSDQPTRRPCLACKQSKVKCTYTSPCLRCIKRSIPCVLPPDASDGRLRRYHRRSTLGCGACKARHVRCDEGRPVCGNCRVRVEKCTYPSPSSPSTPAPIHHPNNNNTHPSDTQPHPTPTSNRSRTRSGSASASASGSRSRSPTLIQTRRAGLDEHGRTYNVDLDLDLDLDPVLARVDGRGDPGNTPATPLNGIRSRPGSRSTISTREGGTYDTYRNSDGDSGRDMGRGGSGRGSVVGGGRTGFEGPRLQGRVQESYPSQSQSVHSQTQERQRQASRQPQLLLSSPHQLPPPPPPPPPAVGSSSSTSDLVNTDEPAQTGGLVARRRLGLGSSSGSGSGSGSYRSNDPSNAGGVEGGAARSRLAGYELGYDPRMDVDERQWSGRRQGYEDQDGQVGNGAEDGGYAQDRGYLGRQEQEEQIRRVDRDRGQGQGRVNLPLSSDFYSSGTGTMSGGRGGHSRTDALVPSHQPGRLAQESSLVLSGPGGMAPMSMTRNDMSGRWVGGMDGMQDGQGYDGLAGMGMGTGAGTVWQPEGSRFMLMDGEHAVDPHLQPVQSEQPLQVGYMTPSSALSTLGSTRDSPEGIDPTPVLPILSRNLFPNRRNPPAAAQEPTYHIPPNVSAFTAASPRVQRASHQAWIKSLWMNAAMTRMPKMVMTVDVDNLEGFFPNTEQRHQFKHFTSQTVDIILTIPTSATGNPWLNLFVPLALSFPHGASLTCDALRLGILSIATFDIGFRMSRLKGDKEEGAKEEDNAMYELSRLQRAKALELLKIAKIAGQLEPDKADSVEMDMTLGATLMLSIRDRLSGSTEWKDPMDLAVRLVLSMGGPNTFLNKRFSKERQFILEQTICVEIIACLTILTPTRLLGRDQAWFLSPRQVEDMEQDHIELVYGLDRETLAYIAEGLYLSDIKRSVEILRYKAKEMREYPEFHTALLSRESEMQAFGNLLLERVGVLRMSTLMTPHATRVVVGNLLFQALMELWVIAEITDDVVHDPRLQTAVDNIFEIVTEAMTRGMFSGFLLPCSWAASFASTPESRLRSTRILSLLKPGYHLDHDLMTRMIRTLWTKFDMESGQFFVNVGPASGKSLMMGKEEGGQLMDYEAWEKFMKEEGLYVPIF